MLGCSCSRLGLRLLLRRVAALLPLLPAAMLLLTVALPLLRAMAVLLRQVELVLLRLRTPAVLLAVAASPPLPGRRALPADAAPQAAWRLSVCRPEARQLPPRAWRPLERQAQDLTWQDWVLARAQSPRSSQAGAPLRAPSLCRRTLRPQRAAPQRTTSPSEHCLLPSLHASLERVSGASD